MNNLAPVDGYIEALCELAGQQDNVMVLDADNSKSTRTAYFASRFPDRFIDLGIAEQNMVGVASGMANAGKIVFANTFAPFLTGKAYDVVKLSVAYSQSNVKLVGCAGGIEMGEAGPSHLAPDDVGLMSLIPNMRILVPSSAEEAYHATFLMARTEGPFYMRVSRRKAVDFSDVKPMELGRAKVIRKGKDVALFCCGPVLGEVMAAADSLERKGIFSAIVSFPTVKPLDIETLIAVARETNAVVTVDEHSVMGGLGGLVCAALAMHHPVPVEMVGIPDAFCPTMAFGELAQIFGLNAENIAQTAIQTKARRDGFA